jgi:hypothetical protein
MKSYTILLIIVALILPGLSWSQENTPATENKENTDKEKKVRDHGLIFLIGPAVNYFYGSKDANRAYSDKNFSWEIDGQLGFLSTRHQTNRGNFLGVFGSFGSVGSDVLQELADQADSGISIKNRQFNQFFSAEAGMVIFNFIRISGGIGRQYYEDIQNNVSSVNYFSLTGGLNFNLGALNLGINANLLTGDDLANNQLRFSAGLMFKF